MAQKKNDTRTGETKAAYRTRGATAGVGMPPSWDFFNPPSVEMLVVEQGIRPLTKASFERADFWPEDCDVEEFIALAKGERDPR